MENIKINDNILQNILSVLSKNGYCFEEITLDNCEDLKHSIGLSFISLDFHSGFKYRVYIIQENTNNQVYHIFANENRINNDFVIDFKEISCCNEKEEAFNLQIFLHKICEYTQMKDFLHNNYDDNYKLQSLYDNFVKFYNFISKHHIRIDKAHPNIVSLNINHEIRINNLDYLYTEDIDNSDENNNHLNAIWLLTFLRVVTNNPDLLLQNEIFKEAENILSDNFLNKHIIPYLNDKEYQLLFSIITCKQYDKTIDIEVKSLKSINTEVTRDDWKCAIKDGDGWFSNDFKRFYGIHKNQSCGFFHSFEGTIKLDGKDLSIICNSSLSDLSSYKDIEFPEGVTTLGIGVFSGVSRINRINFPESLKYIYGNPFEGVIVEEINNLSSHFIATRSALYSKGLHRLISYYSETKEFIVPSQTKIIGKYAFAGNKYIEKVTIGDSVNEISYGAFSDCVNLKEVSLPKSLKIIDREAFRLTNLEYKYKHYENNCASEPSLEELRIPCSVESIGRAAFMGIHKLENDSPYFIISNDALFSNDGADLLYYFGNAKKYQIPSGVRTVWESAFMGNQLIEEIIIPDTVRIIESSAFENCLKLRSVIIESDNLSLGEYAFQGCEQLCSIKMPKKMGNLKYATFMYCEALTEIEIPEGVETIEKFSFFNCSSLLKVLLPSSIKTIGEEAFDNCKKIKEIVFPEGLKRICSGAFDSCSSLTNLILPNSLESVEKWAFSGCDLQKCFISNEKTSISYEAFKSGNDDMLLFIPSEADPKDYYHIIPEGVRGYSESRDLGRMPILGPKTENIIPYIDNKSLEELLNPTEDHYTYYPYPTYIDENGGEYADGMQRLFAIKGKIKNEKKYIVASRTKYICNEAFGEEYSWSKEIPFEEIELPNTIKAIGNYSFANCKIKNINLPDSLEYIGDYAFLNCNKLTSIIIPKNVKHIGINPFFKHSYYHSTLKNVVSESPHFIVESNCLMTVNREKIISCFQGYRLVNTDQEQNLLTQEMYDCILPEGVKVICKYAFGGSKVKSISLPHSLQSIEEGAFEDGKFTSLLIPHMVNYIGEKAFSNCETLEKINILSDKISIIEKELFDGCKSLMNINIPECVTEIGDYAFRGCLKLSSICLPTNIKKININPFIKSGISQIICETDSFNVIDGILYGNKGKDIVAVLTSANKTIIIPDGVETIRQEAFACNTNVEEVICPASLKNIGIKSFTECTSLRSVQLERSAVKELPDYVFSGCKQLECVLLPENIRRIGKDAFEKCEKLESLTLLGIFKIEDNAFEKSAIKNIYLRYGTDRNKLPWSWQSRAKYLSFEDSGFYKDEYGVVFNKDKTTLLKAPSNIKQYIIPKGTKVIGNLSFQDANNLKKLTIPNTVKKIGSSVFHCKFDELILPESVKEIGDSMFLWSHNMREFTIPSSVKVINGNPFGKMHNTKGKQCKIENKSEAFALINGILYSKDLKTLICCTDLTKKVIDILDTVTQIKERAFSGSKAKTIIIPNTVRKIGLQAFADINVSKLCIPDSVKTIGNGAFQRLHVTELHIPGSIKILPDKSFGYCSAEKIVLLEGIKEIKHEAFTFCRNLIEISIPSSVDIIERAAFWGCHNLQTIIINNPKINIEEDAFYYCDHIKKVIIPKGSIEWFKKTPKFSNKLEENKS